MRLWLLVTAAVGVLVTVAAPAASGDGGPGGGVLLGWDGIERGPDRYVAVPAGGRTVLERIRRSDGRVIEFMHLKGTWGIPMVAADGTMDGLMNGGRRLLLGENAAGPYLRRQSSFTVVDLKRLRTDHVVRIPGHHVFDAASPDGRYLYFVEYLSQRDLIRYRVRVYDVRASRLLQKPVIDKRERESVMRGAAISRAAPRGGWVYTLYGGGDEVFVHALDTRNAQAICLDLWKSQPKRLFEFRLRIAADGRLVVRGPRGRALAVVDRDRHRVLSSVAKP